jgi:hypothetical protein
VPKALHRFIGSIAFVAAPRIAFAVLQDRDNSDRRLFLHAKNNLSAQPQGLAFRLKQTIVGPGQGIVASCVEWEPEPVDITANEAMAAENSNRKKEKPRDAAQTFLREMLADGPVPSTQVQADTKAAGLSWATVRRAQEALQIVPRQEGKQWVWGLPLNSSCSHAHFSKVSNWTENRHFSDQSEHLNSCPTADHPSEPEANLDDVVTFEDNGPLTRDEAERAAAKELWPELPPFLDRKKRSI